MVTEIEPTRRLLRVRRLVQLGGGAQMAPGEAWHESRGGVLELNWTRKELQEIESSLRYHFRLQPSTRQQISGGREEDSIQFSRKKGSQPSKTVEG